MTRDNPDKTLANIIFVSSLILNIIGLIASFVTTYPNEAIRRVNISICVISIIIIALFYIFFVFFIKRYHLFEIILAFIEAIIIYPSLFFTSNNSLDAFILYFFIIPTVYGCIIRKPWELVFPIGILLLYLSMFTIAYNENIMRPIIYAQLTFEKTQFFFGFTATYLFVLFCTYFVTMTTIASRKAYIELSTKDDLTGLFNRRKLDNDLANHNYKYGIMMDVDNFKIINDTYGHETGDKVLQKLAEIVLKHCTNEFTIYRYGGEEFFVISRFNEEDTFKHLKCIFSDVRSGLKILDRNITISCGISENIDDNIDNFLKEADAQMYISKHNGKDQATFLGENLGI